MLVVATETRDPALAFFLHPCSSQSLKYECECPSNVLLPTFLSAPPKDKCKPSLTVRADSDSPGNGLISAREFSLMKLREGGNADRSSGGPTCKALALVVWGLKAPRLGWG